MLNVKKAPWILISLLIVLLLCSFWDLMTGLVSLHSVEQSWFHSLNQMQAMAVYDIRLPRFVMAGLCGALFAASGVILQTVMRNPLAAPDVVGVTAGAAVMAAAALIIFPTLTNMNIAWLASFGALCGFLLSYYAARTGGYLSPTRLALTGVAVGATLLAVEHFLLLMAPVDIGPSLSFIAGTVYATNWDRVSAIWIEAVILLSVTLCLGRSLDLLALQDETAIGIGFSVRKHRSIALLIAVSLAGLGVAGAGILGFVGLIAPQIARALMGSKHAYRLPCAMLVGAILVIAADTLGRVIAPPIELPAGIVTTLIGTPYFLWLLIRGGQHGRH